MHFDILACIENLAFPSEKVDFIYAVVEVDKEATLKLESMQGGQIIIFILFKCEFVLVDSKAARVVVARWLEVGYFIDMIENYLED